MRASGDGGEVFGGGGLEADAAGGFFDFFGFAFFGGFVVWGRGGGMGVEGGVLGG
jgi:hypothetical protein